MDTMGQPNRRFHSSRINSSTPPELLERHRRLRIRTLLSRLPDDAAPEIVALFDLVYEGRACCTLEQARAIHDALERSGKTVGDLLDGWRP